MSAVALEGLSTSAHGCADSRPISHENTAGSRATGCSFQTSIPQRDGSSTWTFDVVGIYDLPEPKVVLPAVMIHWTFRRDASGRTRRRRVVQRHRCRSSVRSTMSPMRSMH